MIDNDILQKPNQPVNPETKIRVKCWFCGIELANRWAKNAHLRHCTKRLTKRYFLVGKYVFVVLINPLRKSLQSIETVINDTHDAKILIGTLIGFKEQGLVSSFTAVELKHKPALPIPDGRVKYQSLSHHMSYEDFRTLQKEMAVKN